MDGHFKQPPEIDYSHEDNLSEKWKRWKQTMNLYLEVAMGEKTEKEQCRAVVYVIGLEGREIYNTFNFGENEADKLEVLLKKFEDYCIPKKNVTVIRHRFNTRVQNSSESIDQYLTDLKLIAKNCEFEHLKDGLIRDRIVCGMNSSRVKERLIRMDGLTLDKAVGICRANEESRKQMKTLNEEEQVHALRRKTQNQEPTAKKATQRKFRADKIMRSESRIRVSVVESAEQLTREETVLHKVKSAINAKSRITIRSFVNQSFRKSVHRLDEYSSCKSDGENYFVGAVNRKMEIKENACFSSFKLQGKTVQFKIDTGAQVNILPLSIYKKLSKVKLSKTFTSLTSYSGDKLKVVGKCSLHLKDKNCEFFVTDTNQSLLLGFKASNELGLIHVIMTVQTDVDDPVKSFPKVFTGLGCLEKPYHIKIDSSVNPVINPPRKIPAAAMKSLKGTLKEMEDKEVIRRSMNRQTG
ncbi:unnamed protein product [Mytilus coruscus]|uniref:Retrotransposon gag domain-containing protein n=1 Tax=Mytilus coruscus TaxID=42192 RepID=A0A6J8EGY0_MYTCO|nr:unnamed protein product [Mytilus coruscus]